MSIIVKGMEMPKKYQYCGFLRLWCNANNKLLKQGWYSDIDITRPGNCPLVELSLEQGRIVDAEVVVEKIVKQIGGCLGILEDVGAGLKKTLTILSEEWEE